MNYQDQITKLSETIKPLINFIIDPFKLKQIDEQIKMLENILADNEILLSQLKAKIEDTQNYLNQTRPCLKAKNITTLK